MSQVLFVFLALSFRVFLGAQSIIDRLEPKDPISRLYVVDDPSIVSLNGIAFMDDNIRRLEFCGKRGMKLRALNGVKRWPRKLDELWISNLPNFRLTSLSDLPDRIISLGLKYVQCDSMPVSDRSISLPPHLRCVSLTHCKLTPQLLAALDFASLRELTALDLACLDHFEIMKYSETNENPILFPTSTLKFLCIDFKLIQNIMTYQEMQNMNQLEYVLARIPKAQQVEKKHISEMTNVYKYFNVWEGLKIKINSYKLKQ